MQAARKPAALLGLATLAALGLAASLAPVAHAQIVVAPNSAATAEGGGQANSAPFNNVSRYQQIYDSSQFSALSGPEYITQIAFRPSQNQTTPFSHSLTDIEFDLSTTAQTVSGLSQTFSDNVGADDTVVFSGPLTLSSAGYSGSGPGQFDVIVNLTNPFLYDPSAGNLLLDIRNSSSGFTGYVDGDAGGSATRLNFVDNTTSAASGTVQAFGLATQLTFAPAPEPSQFAGLGLGVLGLTGLALRARRRIPR